MIIFERFMADSGPGSWREGAKVISLALVELTERIHAAISLRLQQTQAVAALLRRARDLASGGMEATQRAREYLWNASGSIYATLWVQAAPASDQQVRLERWLMHKGGSPLPLVDDAIWERALRPRTRPAAPPPPQPLVIGEDWDPGDDPRIRESEAARARLVEKLIAAGSSAALDAIGSIEELRLLASFLWLPRESAPLRRLGLRIQPAGANMARRATVPGPGFVVEMDNYRFTATTASRQAAAEARRAAEAVAAAAAMERISVIASGGDENPPMVASAPEPAVAVTHPLEDFEGEELVDQAAITRPLEAVTPDGQPAPARAAQVSNSLGSAEAEGRPTGNTGPRRFWPLPGLLRRNGESRRERD
jgi:hypothetical protein